MKPLLLVLTAFFVQSCYTVLYTTDQYSTSSDVPSPTNPPGPIIIVLEPPPPPYTPPPPVVVNVAASTTATQPAVAEPARPRTTGETRGPVIATPPTQTTVNPGARERVVSPTQQDQSPRQRPH